MEKNDTSTIKAVAKVMAASFAEDPMHKVILYGLNKKNELLAAHSIIHTAHAFRGGQLRLLDGNPGAYLIGRTAKMKADGTT